MKKIFLSAMIIVPGIILQSCGSAESREEKSEAAASAPEVEVIHPVQGSLISSIRLPGELVAFQQVDLYAKISSFVRRLYVDVGSEVKAGQLLATMEAPELNSQLSGAESRLKSQEALYLSSKATYERLLETSKTPGTISPNDLDIALAKQKSDLAQLEAARASYREIGDNRNYLEIRAPFSGVISARNVSAGAYVGPAGKGSDAPIFTLQEYKKLRLVVSVPESYIPYFNDRTEVKFTVKSIQNDTFTAKVSRASGTLDTRLRSQRTEMDVVNESRLLPGMVAEVSIPLAGENNTLLVPSKAVLHSTTGTFVIKVEDNKTVWVPVKVGRSADDKTEVFGNLSATDVIVKTVTEEVRNGADVKKVKLLAE
ncbi:MAG TPA: efflux RND transporter periplasmic adaptor subunit [Chitinophagaceae bacterium]|nr:efflux RND transporter periplasmic adaptor subunit [Chitinophagaceae bacterium]